MKPLTTLEYANTYFQTKLSAEAWETASEETKTKLLTEATRRIYAIQGFKYSPEMVELLTTVPDDLQMACCEVALTLASGGTNNPHIINQNLGIKSISFGQDSASYDESAKDAVMPAYIFNSYAQSILNRYILKGFKYV